MSWQELDRASRLLALHLTEAVARLGPEALDVIDLPPLTGASVEPAQLQAVAAMYWAMEVDAAGVLDFIDALAEGMRLGRFAFDLGRAESQLFDWHRRRAERLEAAERSALYDRLFAGDEIETVMGALCDRLTRVYSLEGPTPRLLSEIAASAEQLATALSARSAGVIAFAAREIVGSIREALAILHSREVLAAFGRRSVVDLLVAAGPAVVGRVLDPARRFDQARAGQEILSWLADVAPSLEGGQIRLTPADAVVHAAASWQAPATLDGRPPGQPVALVPPAGPQASA